MTSSTKRFHQTLIRLLKGCLTAWERWIHEQPVEGQSSVENT